MTPNVFRALLGANGVSWRGVGQNMGLPNSLSGGTNAWSKLLRNRHKINTRFDRFKLVFPCFVVVDGPPIADQLISEDFTIQCGFEQGYTNSLTGLPARIPVTFNGADTWTYSAASPPADGYIISDEIVLPSYVEAGEFFGIWTTYEVVAGAGNNKIPVYRSLTNFQERYIGSFTNNTSLIAADSALTRTSVTTVGTVQSGSGNGYSPCMMLIPNNPSQKFVFAMGDSIGFGSNEGQAGSGANGDSMGSPAGNAGFISRAIYDTLGYECVNYGRSSDRASYAISDDNAKYRLKLASLARPTHVVNQYFHNDVGVNLPYAVWSAGLTVDKWLVLLSSSKLYIVTTAGVTGSTTLDGTESVIADGTAEVTYLMAVPAGTSNKFAACTISVLAQFNEVIKNTLGDVPVIVNLGGPKTTSTDSFATVVNQTSLWTASSATIRRLAIEQIVLRYSNLMLASAYMDPTIYLENDVAGRDGKWVVNGAANYATQDGIHPNSTGNVLAAAALNAGLFA